VLVEMLGLYAGHLDGWILAEGIETLGELDTLRRLGVPLGQGYVLGRPAGPWSGVEAAAADALGAPTPTSSSSTTTAPRWGRGRRRPCGRARPRR
jgi:EAL domain-containing protein (putative c-di-GMP-specific phosphodiesterase class I)